jgi:hypothetical protein
MEVAADRLNPVLVVRILKDEQTLSVIWKCEPGQE